MNREIGEQNAKITYGEISIERGGILTCHIGLEYNRGGQGFGGITLYMNPSFENHEVMSYAGYYISRVMEIAGVENWKDLAGKNIRVKADMNSVSEIGHIIKDDWYNFKEHINKIREVKDHE